MIDPIRRTTTETHTLTRFESKHRNGSYMGRSALFGDSWHEDKADAEATVYVEETTADHYQRDPWHVRLDASANWHGWRELRDHVLHVLDELDAHMKAQAEP